MWKKAIQETLFLIKMEKASHSEIVLHDKGEKPHSDKLAYQELIPCLREVTSVWENILAVYEQDDNGEEGGGEHAVEKTVPNARLIEYARRGVPQNLRGRIWLFLMQQQRLTNVPDSRCENTKYEDLLPGETPHENAIHIDTGRTFPGHPYFSKTSGPGQKELFNILKAYSLLDPEVGYCQGLCFIVGMLLMHMQEISAFHVLKYMMHDLGLRKQFRPNMLALQIKLFQLKRLIHNHYKDVHDHFESHEITPSLYATPWFLTLFASQFPLGFVARVFDMIFVQGVDAMFKVALKLIGHYRTQILECDCFESIADFLKTTLPELVRPKMIRILNEAFELDVKAELQAFEVEYYMYSEEMAFSPSRRPHFSTSSDDQNGSDAEDPDRPPAGALRQRRKSIDVTLMHKMARQNESLKNQNVELLEKLRHAQSQLRSSELSICAHQIEQDKLKAYMKAMERERAALLAAMAKLYKMVPREAVQRLNRSLSSSSTPPASPSAFSISKGSFPFTFPGSPDVEELSRSRSGSACTEDGNSWSLDKPKLAIDLDMIYSMEHENGALRNQNLELIERLQRAQSKQRISELSLCSYQLEKDKIKAKVRTMEVERSALLVLVAKLWKAAPKEARRRIHIPLGSTPPESPSPTIGSKMKFFPSLEKGSPFSKTPPLARRFTTAKMSPLAMTPASGNSSSSSAAASPEVQVKPKFPSEPILRRNSDTPPPSPSDCTQLENNSTPDKISGTEGVVDVTCQSPGSKTNSDPPESPIEPPVTFSLPAITEEIPCGTVKSVLNVTLVKRNESKPNNENVVNCPGPPSNGDNFSVKDPENSLNSDSNADENGMVSNVERDAGAEHPMASSSPNAENAIVGNGEQSSGAEASLVDGIGPVSSVDDQDSNRSHRTWSTNIVMNHVVWC